MDDPPIYGLDIETDTSDDGLDPQRSSIVAAAVAGDGWTQVFHASELGERGVLVALERIVGSIPRGVLATWNGSRFDLPFIDDRALAVGATLSLRLRPDGFADERHALAGHAGGYLASWYDHRHVDGYQLYRGDVGRVVPISCGLKSVARFVGLTPVEVDRTAIHRLTPAELDAYVASDAELARELVMRRVVGRRVTSSRRSHR